MSQTKISLRTFMANVEEARENGADVVCVECGIGLAQDGCDMHEPGCSHEHDNDSWTVAALYVETNGVYYGLPNVDPWDEERDARLYAGPWPVVAHPPCNRWCQMAYLNQKLHGYRVGDDGGCFAAAIKAVRTFGGVLEHPAHSYAWAAFDLPEPPINGWLLTFCGGWVTRLDQGSYGHAGRKSTWLYAVVNDPPPMNWRTSEQGARWWLGVGSEPVHGEARLRRENASKTPSAFRDVLLDMARSVSPARLDGCT